MKTILAAMMCAVLLGLTFAGSSYAAEQMPNEFLVAMASFKSVCGGNTGKACPGQGSVAAPPVTPAPKLSPAPVLPQPAPVTVPPQLAPSPIVPLAPTTSVLPSAPAASTPLAAAVIPSTSSVIVKGDRVQVKKGSIALNVRDAVNGNVLGQQPELAVGTVTGTPQSVGGRNWVYVDYDTGVDGWSTDGSLVGASAGSASPPTANAVASSTLASTLQASYLGITGEDKVGQGNQTTPNGKADFHISASGLRGTPTKVTVTGNTGGIWETPYNGANWIIATQYNGSTGDLWFEPYASARFHVKVQYADGSIDEVDATNTVVPPQVVAAPVQTVTPTSAPVTTPAPALVSPVTATPLPVTGDNTYYVSSGLSCNRVTEAVGDCDALVSGSIPAGSDSNPGTLAQPWQTMRGALKNIIARYGINAGGVTLIVRGGAYDTENGLLTDNGQDTLLPAGSSWNAPFAMQAYPGEYVALIRDLNPGHRNTITQVQAAVHFPTKENCAYYHSLYPNVSNAYEPYPGGCVAGATGNPNNGDYTLWEFQDDSGEVSGPTIDVTRPTSHHVKYVIFDGINIDSRGINSNSVSTGGDRVQDSKGDALFTDAKFKNLEIKNAAISCFNQPGVDNLTFDGNNQQDNWEFSYFKIHHCGVPFDTYVIPGETMPARESAHAMYLHGFYLHVLGITCDHCEAYLSAGSGMGGLTSLTNSYIHDNAYFGIQGANFTSNNVFYNNGRAAMQQAAAPGSVIENNTIIAGPKGSFQGMSGVWMTSAQQGVTFQNNIIDGYDVGFENYECYPWNGNSGKDPQSCYITAPNTIRNNLVHVTLGREIMNGGSKNGIDIILPISSNNINQDPRFVNPAAVDFRLQAGSPAIDKGYPNGVSTDFAGKPRPQGSSIDIGAYEYGN